MNNTNKKILPFLPLMAMGLLFGNSLAASTPIQNEVAKLLASDGIAGEQFGYSVAVDGDTAVIGTLERLVKQKDDDDGGGDNSANVFTRDFSGNWTQQAMLLASDGTVGDRFGVSVTVAGDTAVIGAPNGNDDNGFSSGSAYVFTRDGSGNWTQQAKLLASDAEASDQFGHSVAVDGDVAVIGAYGSGDNGLLSGSAYVFTRDGSGAWSQQAKLLADDAAAGERFGVSVAVDGDTAVIGTGALGLVKKGDSSLRSAYVFARDGSGNWSQQAKLLASDGASFDQFGHSVAVGGDTAVIGAYGSGDNGPGSGSAYVFNRDGSGNWAQQAKLLASDAAAGDSFGISVAVDGDTAVIGAQGDGEKGHVSGSAYVFNRDGSGNWTQQAKLLASDAATGDSFGNSVAVAGNTAVIGAQGDDDNGTNSGSAYVFSLVTDEEGPVTSAVLATPNPVAAYTPITISANADDTTTGNSTVKGASFTVNGGAATSMTAADGAFDSPVEAVTATLAAGLPVGVYDVCVSGTDAAGNTGAAECVFLAVYDPAAGFVTGGGWIYSPPGAYVPDLSLTGKASFGFVSKYQKGKNVPTGNTQFQFKAGGLSFRSDLYEWLVVAGARAQYKGVGTINDSGNYGFMLTAIDAALTASTDHDRFRIKIWDKDNADAVVYDNELGADDSADPSTNISGGSIVIHTPKGK